MNKKIWIGLIVVFFLLGILCGIPLGMQKGQYIIFEGMNKALSNSNVNIEVDLNETELIEGLTESFLPLFNQTIIDASEVKEE